MGFFKRLFGKQEKIEPETQSHNKPQELSKPDFPLGENLISDVDIKAFSDLSLYYPLPAGFEYRQTGIGVPMIVHLVDAKEFKFLIEASMLTFDEPYIREDGRTAYKTTEVIKRSNG